MTKQRDLGVTIEMQVLRTPEERFADLPDFPFVPRYTEIAAPEGRLRVAHVEAGPADGAPVLLMHGEPTWSYLYRHMLAGLAERGHRAIAPDLIGFGRSDKFGETDAYTYERHVGWMLAWLRALDLRNVTLFCQDWGGLIGLRLVTAEPDRFARLVVANTGLPVGTGSSEGFERWLQFSQSVNPFPVGQIVAMGCTRKLSPAEIAAYDAPFPDEAHKAAARIFPTLVPIKPGMPSVAENEAAWRVLGGWTKPLLTAFSDQDPVTRGGDAIFQARVPGAAGQPHVTIAGGGHFLQEDKPAELVSLLDRFIRAG